MASGRMEIHRQEKATTLITFFDQQGQVNPGFFEDMSKFAGPEDESCVRTVSRSSVLSKISG